ncbi:terminase small subunit [Desulfosporosinus fructosivorans]|uniref:Terminase small subunit n=1 Tax=Desulfosporosinus fructosivorans TaxID=2018669 RepID=A0A4Z0QZK8_9FIRM|nr:terminase small subunit [Desulfosporosinus fructosivorans]TGE35890.1 terminase small subunit [Desulfosporosinus fructosivorans]
MDWIKLRKEYESTEISLKELAVKHGVSESTMRSRKNREKWQGLRDAGSRENATRNATHDATQRTMQRATKKKNVAPKGNVKKREPKIKVIVNNRGINKGDDSGLSEIQRFFCIYYVKYFNASKAALKAGYSKSYSLSDVYTLLENPRIKKEIQRLKQNKLRGVMLEKGDVLQRYIDIAFADVTDFVEFGQAEQFVYREGSKVKGDNGEYLKEPVNYINLKNHEDVDGALISEVKEGRSGISVKLHDKMKALEKLELYTDLLPDHHKRRIEEEKLKLDQAKFESEKLKATGGGIDESVQKIQTLAQLLNNPAPNRSIKDLE